MHVTRARMKPGWLCDPKPAACACAHSCPWIRVTVPQSGHRAFSLPQAHCPTDLPGPSFPTLVVCMMSVLKDVFKSSSLQISNPFWYLGIMFGAQLTGNFYNFFIHHELNQFVTLSWFFPEYWGLNSGGAMAELRWHLFAFFNLSQVLAKSASCPSWAQTCSLLPQPPRALDGRCAPPCQLILLSFISVYLIIFFIQFAFGLSLPDNSMPFSTFLHCYYIKLGFFFKELFNSICFWLVK